MRRFVAALAIVLCACSDPTLSQPSPSAAPSSATPSPTPRGSPSHLPGSVVRLSVNGVDYPMGAEVRESGDTPVTIVLTFPFAVDRQSVERWGLPASGTKTWVDDRTLKLVFPATESSLAFKIAETLSAGGDTVIDFFVVSVTFPATRVVSVFTVAELTKASPNAPQASSSWRIRSDDGITLSPDAKRVLLYDTLSPVQGPAPTFVELDTKKATPLDNPPASDGWFSFADWMADGRLVMVGRGVWVGDANANDMRRIADAEAVVAGSVWVVVPDPAEKHLALWGYNTDGHIAVVDLATGAVQRVTGPFRRCEADGATAFAWSLDGALLAGIDCDREEGGQKARVRIVDIAADRTMRTIEGGAHTITGLPTGNFIIVRDSGEVGQGSRLLGLVMDFDGQIKGRYLGGGWLMSPDRRYLLQRELSAAGCCGFTLIDLTAGISVQLVLPSPGRGAIFVGPRWLRDGRLAYFY